MLRLALHEFVLYMYKSRFTHEMKKGHTSTRE